MRFSFIEPLESRIAPATVSIAAQTFEEGNDTNTIHVTVALDVAAPSGGGTVNFTLMDGTAKAGQQFNPPGGAQTLTFAEGETSKTIDISLIGNTSIDPDTSFTVKLSDPSGLTLSTTNNTAAINIWDDDVKVTFTPDPLNQSTMEGNSGTKALTYTVALDGHSDHDITVNYATHDGSAISSGEAADYVSKTGSFTFVHTTGTPASQSFTVLINGDTAPGPDENFTVQLNRPSPTTLFGATIVGDGSATTTIVNDEATTFDSALSVVLTNDPTAAEGGAASFGLKLSSISETPVVVKYHLSAGTAGAGEFTDDGLGTHTITLGATDSIPIKLIKDTLIEPAESFTLTLDSATTNGHTVALGTKSTATGTIAADQINVNVAGATVIELADGTAMADFLVTLSTDAGGDFTTTQPITVHFATIDGSAMGGADATQGDYISKSGDLTIPKDTTKPDLTHPDAAHGVFHILVPINKDGVAESTETFSVQLSAPTNATLGTATGAGKIIDGNIDLKVSAVKLAEGNEGTTTALFNLTLGQPVPTGYTLQVTYETVDGDGVSGHLAATSSGTHADYVGKTMPASQTLTFAAGSTFQTVGVIVNGDNVLEGDEVFSLKITKAMLIPTGGTTGTGASFTGADPDSTSGVATIANDESPTVSASITADAATVQEGAANSTTAFAHYTLQLSEAYSSAVTVAYTIKNTNSAGVTTTTLGTKSIDAFATSAAVDPIAYDHADGVGHDQIISVTIDTVTPATSLAGAVFRPLATAKTATTTVLEDDVFVRVTGPTDGKPEGNSGTSLMPFKVQLVDASGKLAKVDHTVSVPFRTVDPDGVLTRAGTGGAADTYAYGATSVGAQADYVAKSNILIFRPGENQSAVDVAINGDKVAGNNEFFLFQLATPTGAQLDPTKDADNNPLSIATGIILDDDALSAKPTLSISPGTGVEGGNVNFTVTLSKVWDSAISFEYATSILTGGADRADQSDFTARNSTNGATVTPFFIPGGQLTSTFSVAAVAEPNTTPENAETFGLMLSKIKGASNLVTDTLSAVGTIAANNVPTLTIGNVSIVEGNTGTSVMHFVATLSAKSTVPVTFNLQTIDGTATAGSDYTALPSTLITIPANMLTFAQDIVIKGDADAMEGDETFTLRASNVSFATPGSVDAIGTILNDDSAFSITGPDNADHTNTNHNVGEADGFANFTVTRTGDFSKSAVVTYHTNPGTNPNAAVSLSGVADFQAQTGTVTFNPGEFSKTIPIELFDDKRHEATENFTVTLSDPHNGILGTSSATANIVDNDAVPTAKISGPVTIKETDSGTTNATFTVTLDQANEETDVNFRLSTTTTQAGGAVPGQDFVAKTNELFTIPKGSTTGTFTVQVTNDTTYDSLPKETFGVSLSLDSADSPARAKLSTGANPLTSTVTIVDNDAAPQVSIAPASFAEGSPSSFVATLNHASDVPVKVQYYTVDGTAKSVGSTKDFTGKTAAAPETLTIAARTTTATFDAITTVDDALAEGSETFSLKLARATGATLNKAHSTALGTITDNDQAFLSINDVSIIEGNNGTKDAVFSVTLTGQTAAPVKVNYTTADLAASASFGSALAGSDYLATSGTVTLGGPGGAQTAQIVVKVVGDIGKENAMPSLVNEQFNVKLSGNTIGTITRGTGVGTILDDGDTLPTLSVNSAGTIEGDSGDTTMTFTATLSAKADADVTFGVHLSELARGLNTARLTTDFLQTADATGHDLTFTIPHDTTVDTAGGANNDDSDPKYVTKSFTVTIKADGNFEPTEFFNVGLTNIAHAAPGVVNGTGTIYDNDVQLIKPTVAKWTDIDGDLVTLTVSKGSLAGRAVFSEAAGTFSGHLLQQLDLAQNAGNMFSHANVTVSVAQQPNAAGVLVGNGRADVGYIRANSADTSSSALEITGVDLGVVKIAGDLSRISVGDLFSNAAIKTLDVYSLGVNSAATERVASGTFAAAAQTTILAGAGTIKVATDISGFVAVQGGPSGKLGSLVVGGALKGTTFDNSGHLALTGRLGSATIHDITGGGGASSGLLSLLEAGSTAGSIHVLGNVTGGTSAPASGSVSFSGSIVFNAIDSVIIDGSLHGGASGAVIAANNSLGKVTIGGDFDGGAKILGGGLLDNHAIKRVIVHGNVNNAQVLGGYLQDRSISNADAQIDYVQVDGSVAKLDILAGTAVTRDSGGTVAAVSGANFPVNNPALFSRIAEVVFNGALAADTLEHVISAQSFGTIIVQGAVKAPSNAGPVELAPGSDFTLRYTT